MDRGSARAFVPHATVFVLALLAQLPLAAGWLESPTGRVLDNPFTGGHVWAVEVVSSALGAGDWPDPTDRAGFPMERQARFLGWAFLLAGTLLRPLLNPHLVVHLAHFIGPALGGATLVLLARQLFPQARSAPLVVGGVLFALSPVTLGASFSGQVENAQSWILPLLLWLNLVAAQRRAFLWLVPAVWALAALTSPYLVMLAAFLSPLMAVWARREVGWAAAVLPLLLAAPALALVQAWLDPGSFSPDQVLYRPSHGGGQWPPLWARPLPVADLDTLLTGRATIQVKANVLHQPYLGLVLLGLALAVGEQRRRFLPVVLLGVALAMGPRLAWGGEPVVLAGHEIPLPGQLARWLSLPIAHGGQYYRAIVLAHLGLALMIAVGTPSSRTRQAILGLGLLFGPIDALRSVSASGLPWPTQDLPRGAWETWAADPVPGAVLHLPLESPRLAPNHPVRLDGISVHRRALSDMPRAWTEPSEHPLMGRAWRSTHMRPTEPPPALAELGAIGFRYAVVDLPAIPERRSLMERLSRSWGPPDGEEDGLSWWRIPPAVETEN